MKYKKQKETTDFGIISDAIVEYFELNNKLDMFSNSRKEDPIKHRQWFHYLARKTNPERVVSLTRIGEYYKNVTGVFFTHATVLNSVKKIKGYVEVSRHDKQIERDLLFIIKYNLEKNNKPQLTGNCPEQQFNIKKYSEIQMN